MPEDIPNDAPSNSYASILS